jgi:hypothetical protein
VPLQSTQRAAQPAVAHAPAQCRLRMAPSPGRVDRPSHSESIQSDITTQTSSEGPGLESSNLASGGCAAKGLTPTHVVKSDVKTSAKNHPDTYFGINTFGKVRINRSARLRRSRTVRSWASRGRRKWDAPREAARLRPAMRTERPRHRLFRSAPRNGCDRGWPHAMHVARPCMSPGCSGVMKRVKMVRSGKRSARRSMRGSTRSIHGVAHGPLLEKMCCISTHR